MGALNLRDNTGEPVPCPHAWCSREGQTATITHILWTCDAARRTWSIVYRQWTRRADPVQPDDLLRSSVGVELPVLARAIRQAMRDEFEDPRTMIATTRQAWRIIQAVVPHQLWLHRNAAAFQATTDSVHGVAAKIWAAISRQLGSFAAAQRMTSTTYEDGGAMEEILRGLSADEPAETREHGEARLYYDGGARGNPGWSGAGAVLLERHSENRSWEIVWWAATYVGDHSTNNVAEHQALAQGLREAARRYGPSRLKIDIVGDSMLVTRQLLGQIRATKPHFSKSLHQSRSALLELFDYGLHHTLRAGNKAADWLANYAMDQQISIVSTTATATQACTIHAALGPRVRTDTTHPRTQTTKNNDLLTRIQTLASSCDHLPSVISAKRPRPEPLSHAQVLKIQTAPADVATTEYE